MEAKLADINEAWKDPIDLLDRRKYSEFLTDYLSKKETSFVLNLNAAWGMGKTYFLTHWYKSLEGKHPIINTT